MDNILNPITAYRKEGNWSLSDSAAHAAGEHRVGRLFQSVGGQAISLEGTSLPDAVVLGYPVITSGEFRHDGSICNLCGDDAALRGTMSLENQVSDGLPPFYIWHTVEDASVPVQNSMLLATALTAHKVPFELHLFAHDGHGTSTCTQEVNTPNRHNSAWVPLCTDWLADTLDFHL